MSVPGMMSIVLSRSGKGGLCFGGDGCTLFDGARSLFTGGGRSLLEGGGLLADEAPAFGGSSDRDSSSGFDASGDESRSGIPAMVAISRAEVELLTSTPHRIFEGLRPERVKRYARAVTTSKPPRRTKAPSRASKAPARHTKGPTRRPTQEVDVDWLEPEIEEALKKSRRQGPPPIPGAELHAPPMPVHPSLSPKAFMKPIPREEEEGSAPPRKSSRSSRAPKKR